MLIDFSCPLLMLSRVQLEQVLEMILFDSNTCMTPGKQIMKFYLKFLSINYRHCIRSVQAVA